jgi:hypothetical protein
MMNLLQVQDDLKNFSQDQLVKEMQQPSGSTPQFLVLSELNRRKRVKGDFEARQAQQQPTVAQDAVASAGVPQQGMMGMSEAMAPASVDSGGIGSMMPQNMKSGGVIRAQDGLPEEPKFGDDLVNYVGGSFPAAIENLNTLGGYLNPFNYFGSDEDKETETVEEVDTAGIDTATNDATAKMPEKKPEQKLNLTSTEPEVLSIEQELLKRQAGLDKDRNFDKYMALAQAGLGILASDKPTLAQAVGEGGMKGLDAFNEANKRYEEGLTDILNARSKLKQAKIKASGKGTLDRKGALAAISSYNNDITAVRKAIQDINKSATDPREQAVRRAALEQELNRLRYEQSQLYGSAGIRQRPTVNVAGLPATQKSG